MVVNAGGRPDPESVDEESRCGQRTSGETSPFKLTTSLLRPAKQRGNRLAQQRRGDSGGPRSAFLRPTNRSPVPGLFLVGGSAHPGGGLPLVTLSAKIVADLVGPA